MTEQFRPKQPESVIDLNSPTPERGLEDMIPGIDAKLTDGTPAKTMGLGRTNPDGSRKMLVIQNESDGPAELQWVEVPQHPKEIIK